MVFYDSTRYKKINNTNTEESKISQLPVQN